MAALHTPVHHSPEGMLLLHEAGQVAPAISTTGEPVHTAGRKEQLMAGWFMLLLLLELTTLCGTCQVQVVAADCAAAKMSPGVSSAICGQLADNWLTALGDSVSAA